MNKIHVIICSWNRINGIKNLLIQLNNQSNKNFYVSIINNNISHKNTLDDLINNIDTTYKIELIHNEINLGGRARFIIAKDTSAKYCVFIDDDQVIPNTLIDNMIKKIKPKSIYAWWGWQFKNNNYWDRIRIETDSECNYCGTGGMIIDSSIFKDEKFWYSWNPKFYFVEDLYLSIYATKNDWLLRGYNFGIQFDTSLASDENSLFMNKAVHASKQELLDFYKLNDWNYINPDHNFSLNYWENRYKNGGNSGSGSYGEGLKNKITLINKLINKYNIQSIADAGCGDCTILQYVNDISKYIGYDISETIINKHNKNNTDETKKFKVMDNLTNIEQSDLILSLEVIFHQVNDNDYITYMNKLINSGSKYILILTMNESILKTDHVKNVHIKYRDIKKYMNTTNYTLLDTFPFIVNTSTYYLYKK